MMMETEAEPELKKPKVNEAEVTIQFRSESGSTPFPPLSVPESIGAEQLAVLLKTLLKNQQSEDEGDEDLEFRPFLFYLQEEEIKESLNAALNNVIVDRERNLPVTFKPQALFRVKPVTRCSSSLPGHSHPVVAALFSPDGRHLASGAGDNTVRFWDVDTETPKFECKGHSNYVLALSWDGSGLKLASGDKNGNIAVWNPETGKQEGKLLVGHKGFITALCWQPTHLCGDGQLARKLCSSSKDGDVRVWDVVLGKCLFSLTSHTMNVTCLRWGGTGLIYSGSQDRTIKVWRASDGVLCRTLQGHGHWVNVLALNTDHVMRTADFDPAKFDGSRKKSDGDKVRVENAAKRYRSVVKTVKPDPGELMVSGSDDFTLYLWNPGADKKHIARMTGHQQLVNDVRFSPDAGLIASASFDKSIRLWDGRSGRFLATLRGHVQRVHQLSWSSDSRLLVSGSADSTLKLWSAHKKKLQIDLPGHGDEIYAVDWSADGQKVVSAGKDTLLRIWRR